MSWQAVTDGAASPDGRGGWAYVVVKDDIEILRGRGSAFEVTHQRMASQSRSRKHCSPPRMTSPSRWSGTRRT